ncbi:hypothetical protein CKAH01_00325 [Colletotrichum kahawae]|uniref:Uncharacterized protein n=1 Tax=Colletotrichum kahawae TaxID=34407 RepID=A0AAD9YUZ2_COLKA|nr:hypothetical protein CKAH01_00325 [Colletotrichum kahawae]
MWFYFVYEVQSTGSLERSSLRDGHVRHREKGGMDAISSKWKRLMASLPCLNAFVFPEFRLGLIVKHLWHELLFHVAQLHRTW